MLGISNLQAQNTDAHIYTIRSKGDNWLMQYNCVICLAAGLKSNHTELINTVIGRKTCIFAARYQTLK
jgi:hypothetical protein